MEQLITELHYMITYKSVIGFYPFLFTQTEARSHRSQASQHRPHAAQAARQPRQLGQREEWEGELWLAEAWSRDRHDRLWLVGRWTSWRCR